MEQNFRTVVCKSCGKELQIPSDLTEFSCLYCGERSSAAEPQRPAMPDAESAYEEACGELAGCVLSHRGYQRKITRNEYKPSFETFLEDTSPVFSKLNAAVDALGDAEQRLNGAAKRMLDDLKAAWDASAERNKSNLRSDDKVVIAIFFVPALRSLRLPISEPLAKYLQEQWVGRYPKDPFYLGDYDSIEAGFRRKLLGLCFITTAVCRASGLPDDCAELTAFRAFRDGYLQNEPDGNALIDEYYNIAPGIVTCIDLCGNADERYADIRRKYLEPCYRDLQAHREADCKARYIRMVRALEKEYLS